MPLFGRGLTRLQPVFVGNAAAAANALTDPAAQGAVYELGGPRVYTYRALVELVLRHTRRRRLLVPVPFAVWDGLARALSVLPNPPLTRDAVVLVRRDNVVGDTAPTLADLNIDPTAIETVLPRYL